MTSITRSGRVLKHEGVSSMKSGNAAPTVTQKDSPHKSPNTTGTKNRINNSTAKDAKSSIPSDSAATDSFGMRKSSRETPTKKTKMGISSSRKPESLDENVESPEKKRQHSPLRRSERIEKNGVSGSPGWTKRNKSSSPPFKKKKLDEVNGRIAVTNKENESKDKKLDIKTSVTSMEIKSMDNKLGINSSGRSKKKTSMNAHRYRALLQAKQNESSDDDDMHLKDDRVPKENSSNSASSSSKKVYEGLDEIGGRKVDMPLRKCSVENSNEAANGSCPRSKELAELTMDSDLHRKSACLSAKEKYKNKSLVSKCTGSSSHLQSSIIGFTTKNNGGDVSSGEICGVDNTCDTQRLGKQELEPSRSVVSTSECQSLIVDKSMECRFNFEDSKNANTAVDLDSNVSISAGIKNICNPEVSKADITSSLPCGTTSQDIKRSNECNKHERIHNGSEAHELCLSNAQREHVLVTSKDRRTYQLSNGVRTAHEHLRVVHLKEPSVAVDSDSVSNVCIVCKHPGQLLCCYGKGCKQSFHLSCLSPPLLYDPLGVWLCHFCVKKKVVSGVYSVSEGIESVWDVKEALEKETHYLVKYKGLAHVHNRWVPESQIILEAPILATKFDKRHQREKEKKWKQEWTEPHRILLKRQLMPKDLADELVLGHGEKISYCYHEWLVKWKGLGYEHATWELENSPFLCSSEAKMLISDFESRHGEAKRSSDSARADNALQVKKSSFHKLQRLPYDCPAGLDSDHLNSVNRLHECWHKSQNAVFIGDQERIIKSILFMLSLKSHTCQPFLVISTIHSLSLWETEFVRLAQSINVVVYTGTKDVRKLIRTLEFYEESGCVMFQVLLSHSDAIVEDFDALECIGWEALIIDECQNPRVSKHLEHFKTLSTEFRLLLLSGQLKDNVAEYVNLISFLEAGGKENGFTGSKSDGNDKAGSLCLLKEKLTRYLVVYDRKSGSSKFLEFWVPVQLSNVQLEQYCSTLVSNSITLHSCSKVDHVGALRDILISTRKCCDYPYLVGDSLQSSLTKDLPSDKYLGIGVKASGKLHLLDKFLHEINKQGLRVLILFQSIGGAGRDSIGDILDDFLRQRFGPDSFERVDSGLIMSKKIAALAKFNDKANGRFVFLIENRACLPSIKLSSVDVVVIFNSDWNPLNDLRALQKIRIESQFDCLKVFRLYSSCTVEEKVLIFAKQDMILDSNIQHISPSNSHLLLSWGAFCLFNELDEFHQHDKAGDDNEISIDEHFVNDSMLKFLNDVVEELVKELPGITENNTCPGLLLVKAQQNGSSYAKNIRLVGERDGITSLDTDPPSFWSKLLEKRYPNWRFISEPSPSIRRKVQLFETSAMLPEVETDGARTKRRKLTSNIVNPISLQTWLEDKTKEMSKDAEVLDDISHRSLSQPETTLPAFPSNNLHEPETYGSQADADSKCMPSSVGIMDHVTCNFQTSSTSDDAAELHKSPMSESVGRRNAQRTLHLCLKPELSELCDTLKLPDDVKHLTHKLLEYIMNNHHVNRDLETILQAFKLSLCWRAASFLKHKVDHKECLALAKKYLNYKCNEEQADSVYSKLRMLKKIFSQKVLSAHDGEPNSLGNRLSTSRQADIAQPLHGGASESASSHVQDSGQVKAVSDDHGISVLPVLEQEQAPVRQPPSEVVQPLHGGISESSSSQVQDSVQIKAISNDHGTSVRPVLEQEHVPVRQPPSEVARLLHGGTSESASSHVQDYVQIKVISDDHGTSVKPVLEQVRQPLLEVAQLLHGGSSELASSHVQDSGKIKVVSDDHGTSVQPVLEQEQAHFRQPPSEVARPLAGGNSESSSHVQDSGQIKAVSDDHGTSVQPVLEEEEQAPVCQLPSEVQENLGSLKDVLLKKRVDLINIISSNRNASLLQKHNKELSDFNVQSEKEKARFKSAHDVQLELIHSIHTDYRRRNHKIKLLNQDFSKKMSECDQHMTHQLKKLAIMQEDAKNKEQNIRDCWLEEAKAGTLADTFDTLPLTETGFRLEEFKEISEKVESCEGSKQSTSDLMCSDLITTAPRVPTVTSEKHSEIRSSASNSSDIAEVQPLQPDGSSSEVLKTVLLNSSVEVELNERNETLAKTGLDSVLLCTDVITTVPGISTGTTENHLETASTSPIGVVEDAQSLPSHSNTVVEAERIQQNGTSAELPETVPTSMSEMESVDPNETHKEIAETILPAADGSLWKNGGPEFSESEVMNVVGNDPHSTHMGPQTNLTTAEIVETVSPNMVEVESIEHQESYTEIPTELLPSDGSNINKGGETPFSESDVNVAGNQPDTIYMAPSMVTSLPEETETIALQSNNMVQVESVDPNGTSSLPEECHVSMDSEPPPSQMNTEDNGSDVVVIDSTVETTAAIIDRDLRRVEDNSDGTQLRSSPLQNPADLLSIPHVSANTCCEKMLSNLDQVLQVNEHERPAVSVETECEEGVDSSHTTTPVSVGFVTLQVEPTAHHTDTSNPAQLQLPPVDNSPADNDQSSTSQSLRNEGELHTIGTHSSPSVTLLTHAAELQAEESNQLASQSVLHPSPPSGMLGVEGEVQPHGIYGTISQNEMPAQQPVVTAAVQADQCNELSSQPADQCNELSSQPADQCNELSSQPVVHSSVVSANLLPDRTHSDGIESRGVLQELGTRLLQFLQMTACVHPQALHPDPLQNELTRIQKQVELRTNVHEKEKLQRKLECEAELEKVRKKYEALIQEDEAGFHQDKKILDTIYNKVLVNQILAEEFRSKFIDRKGGTSSSTHGRSSGSMPQFLQTPYASPRTPSTSFMPNLTNRPPIALPQAQVPISSSAPPGLVIRSTPSVIPPSTHVRSQFSPRPNIQGATDSRTASQRAPAPHLHRFRPHTSSMMSPVILPPRPGQVSAPQLPLSNLGAITSRALLSTPLLISRDLIAANVAPDMPSLLQMDVGHSLYGSVSHNPPVNIYEKTTTNGDNVVCLSDDE